MTTPILTMEDLSAAVARFLDTVPTRFHRHHETREIGRVLDVVRLTDLRAARFTLAVIGPMKAGKSTLVNALIGRDLAPTGVTETTATLNRIRYGRPEDAGRFVVHRHNGAIETLPIGEIGNFLAGGRETETTAWLELTADAPFLKRADLVDTPGTGSTYTGHEDQTRAFLAERLARETRTEAGRADAVLYVLTPAAVAGDQDAAAAGELLDLFGDATRLPGASPANSIAVLQRWESLEPDPIGQRLTLERSVRRALAGKVDTVLAVSGLIGTACLNAPDPALWQDLAALGTRSRRDGVDQMLAFDDAFRDDEIAGAALDAARRSAIASRVPWPVIRFAVRVAQRHAIADGAALQTELWQLSGIDRLRDLVERRFCAVADLVRAGTILRRTQEPCWQGLLTLRQALPNWDARIARKQAQRDRATHPDDVRSFDEDLATLSREQEEMRESERLVDQARDQLETQFALLDQDLAGLARLDGLASDTVLTADDRKELRRVFGAEGLSLMDRLGWDGRDRAAVLAHAEARLGVWQAARRRGGGDERALAEQAARRYESLLLALEAC